MFVDFTDEDRRFCVAVGRERHRQNEARGYADKRASGRTGEEPHIHGVYGELAFVIGFGLDRALIRWDRPGRDESGIDFTLANGRTVQVKAPYRAGLNLIIPHTDPEKFGRADYGVLVDLYDDRWGDVFGWITRADFIKHADLMPKMKEPCVGVYRDRLTEINGELPGWAL